MNRALHVLVAIPLASALLYACDDPEPTPTETPSGYEDVVYEGEVTDEALLALASALDQGPPEPSIDAPTLIEPTAVEQMPSVIPTFSWTYGASADTRAPAQPARREILPDLRDRGAVDIWGSGSPTGALRPKPQVWISPLRELFGPERAASAHGTPYTGYATFLIFGTDADDKLVRVFTSETMYVPTQEAWDKLSAAGAPITLTMIGAQFEENRVAEAGGPYKGTTFTFTIAAP